MKVDARQAELVEIVRRQGKASVEELAQALGASRETIRRDLTQLSGQGRIQKVHGGAQIPRILGEGPFKQRLSENVDAKIALAGAAAALVRPGETLFVDTGSTTLYFAERIAQLPELTVITNSTEIARTIAAGPGGSRAFLLGGAFSPDNSQTVGAMAVAHAANFRAHHAFLTIGAMDARGGAMDFDFEEAQIARAMIAQAEAVTILADSSKFGSIASFEVCPLGAIDRLVSDHRPPGEIAAALDAGDAQIVLPDGA